MLRIFLLGHFAVEHDGAPITRWGGHQTRELVKVLAAAAGSSAIRRSASTSAEVRNTSRRLELLEGRHDSALVAVERAAASATATSSLKYVVLSKALRAEILGSGEDGPQHASSALELDGSEDSTGVGENPW